jgi:uncharacterized protein YbjT (DUF2867 family)
VNRDGDPILVTGAGGGIGGVGRTVVALLRERDLPVRAMVHREDERAGALRDLGADVVAGDLTRLTDVRRVMDGCRRMLFCMSASPDFLQAAATVAAVGRALGTLELLVDLSQLTVSQMSLESDEESEQQHLHWLSEHVFDWSGLPVVHVRPTIFQENPLFTTVVACSLAQDGALPLPFGEGRTSPVSALDVADVVATVLEVEDPSQYVARVLELTGPVSEDMNGVAEEYSRALGRTISYHDVPADEWAAGLVADASLTPHVREHVVTLARLHRQDRFDRMTDTVATITGHPARTMESFVREDAALFRPS